MCNKLLVEFNFGTNKEVKAIFQTITNLSVREVNVDGFVKIIRSIIMEEHFWK